MTGFIDDRDRAIALSEESSLLQENRAALTASANAIFGTQFIIQLFIINLQSKIETNTVFVKYLYHFNFYSDCEIGWTF